MEFYQVPGRSRRSRGGAACADRKTRRTDKRNRGTIVNENEHAISDELPDRLSTDPKSPYYNADILARDVGIRFKGVEKTNVEEYCVSEGWVSLRATHDKAKHHYATPFTKKVHGRVEPYFRDKEQS